MSLRSAACVVIGFLAGGAQCWQRPASNASKDAEQSLTPSAVHVDLTDTTLSRFDERKTRTLIRYLAGNSRWEIRHERGIRYAVRKELVDGTYQTVLNGFYSEHDGKHFRSTRVILSFEKQYGLGRDRRGITTAKPGTKDVSVILRPSDDSAAGYTSFLIVEGGNVSLEIYDRAPEKDRRFTRRAYAEVSAELADVLAHVDEIDKTGVLTVTSRYAESVKESGTFKVRDGMQPGIYILDAFVNPKTPGTVYARVFDAKTGNRLSERRLTEASMRSIGWADSGSRFFPYQAEVTVYEGDWDHKYEALFEVWHRDDKGNETKLAETRRMINGWER